MSELLTQLQETLGRDYTVEREVGGGGMSRVFVATDNVLGRKVAIKVLLENLAATVSLDRFKREIMVVAALQHPHVVGILTAGESNGLPYYVMPFVEGESLRRHLQRSGAMTVGEALPIMKDVARAMAYAHDNGVVHRDIKPDNVLLSSGSAALTDFGVAKAVDTAQHADDAADPGLTMAGTSLGTPTYIAPEQAAGDAATDHRADIYAFGVMAYEMLAGVPPFHGKSPQALMVAHIAEPPPPLADKVPSAPPGLADLIMQCLEKEAADRPQSAGELVEALESPSLRMGTGDAITAAHPAVVRRYAPVAVAFVLVLVLAAMFVMNRSPSDRGASATTGTSGNSVAVLPLVNVGGDSANEYFADGMTDELTSALSKVPGLRVASRTAAFRFRGSQASVEEIGRTLNVATLLEGTVRRGGSRIRLTASLVDASDGLALWSDTYERQVSDVFSMQDDLSQAIVTALRSHFGDAVAASPEQTHGTENVVAYDLYLRGRYFFEKRGEESLLQAAEFYQQAVAKDSSYAAPYAGLADVYALLPLYGGTPADSAFPLALQAANRAITLDSALAAAYAARGGLLNATWRWEEAEQDLLKAIALDPNYATAHQWYSDNRLINGHVEEAVAAANRATTLDPLSPVMAAVHALALGVAGREAEAEETGRRAVELAPSLIVARFLLGAVYLYAGRADDAIRELEIVVDIDDTQPEAWGLLGYAYAVAGQPDRARSILASIDSVNLGNGNAAAIARIHLGLDDTERALTWYERAADQRDTFFGSESMASPIFDPLRDNPRFAALLRRVNLDVEALTN